MIGTAAPVRDSGARLLAVEGLARHFRLDGGWLFDRGPVVRAVDGVSFTLDHGETLGLVGESGCGKTTIGRLVLGLDQPTAGAIVLRGQDLSGLSAQGWRAMRREAQMVFQDPLGALDPRMPIGRQIAEPLEIHGLARGGEPDARALEMLAAVGLSADIAQRYPHEISGGQQQRAVIARAFVLKPRFVVCDEPVSALDVSVQAQVVNLLAQLQQEYRLAYLFISHDLKVVRHISHRIAVMYLGQIVETAPREELFARPLHPYTRALIAAVPVPDPAARRSRTVLRGDPPSPIRPPAGCRFHTRCPAADARCRVEAPAFEEVAPRHWVSCHFAAASGEARKGDA